jgi:hypothetical protein
MPVGGVCCHVGNDGLCSPPAGCVIFGGLSWSIPRLGFRGCVLHRVLANCGKREPVHRVERDGDLARPSLDGARRRANRVMLRDTRWTELSEKRENSNPRELPYLAPGAAAIEQFVTIFETEASPGCPPPNWVRSFKIGFECPKPISGSRRTLRLSSAKLGSFEKFPSPPLEGSPIRVHLWFRLGVVDRRAFGESTSARTRARVTDHTLGQNRSLTHPPIAAYF